MTEGGEGRKGERKGNQERGVEGKEEGKKGGNRRMPGGRFYER